jgi:hypothetical protein
MKNICVIDQVISGCTWCDSVEQLKLELCCHCWNRWGITFSYENHKDDQNEHVFVWNELKNRNSPRMKPITVIVWPSHEKKRFGKAIDRLGWLSDVVFRLLKSNHWAFVCSKSPFERSREAAFRSNWRSVWPYFTVLGVCIGTCDPGPQSSILFCWQFYFGFVDMRRGFELAQWISIQHPDKDSEIWPYSQWQEHPRSGMDNFRFEGWTMPLQSHSELFDLASHILELKSPI